MANRKQHDRIAAEQVQQIELKFPGLQALCDAKDMNTLWRKPPIATSEQSLLVTKGMHVTEPKRRKA